MAISIETNIASLTAQRQLTHTSNKLSTSMERLSSGKRINSAKDDAGGLAITNRMEAQIRGINRSIQNLNDASSLVQIAASGVAEVVDIVQRIRELAVQGVNGTNTTNDRKAIYTELSQLADQMDLLSGEGSKTGISMIKYNGMSLSDESVNSGNFSFQVGYEAGNTFTVGLADIDEIIDQTVDNNSIDNIPGLNYSAAAFEDVIDKVDSALSSQTSTNNTDQAGLLGVQAYLGSTLQRIESMTANLYVQMENTAASNSRIKDADIAKESANLTSDNISRQAGVAIMAQANQQPQLVLQLLA
ncbi:MAG: flagellin FliC [Magnetococcales bacterium]|nr:flagellin FliC [Magnetococcales bacterium]